MSFIAFRKFVFLLGFTQNIPIVGKSKAGFETSLNELPSVSDKGFYLVYWPWNCVVWSSRLRSEQVWRTESWCARIWAVSWPSVGAAAAARAVWSAFWIHVDAVKCGNDVWFRLCPKWNKTQTEWTICAVSCVSCVEIDNFLSVWF